jgi:NADH-quinone oxidoreductase subunit J
METAFFLLFSALTIFCALMVILQKNPLASVLFLVMTLFWLAALFVLLSAPFIAAIQVIIYAGAIMVLFLFVLMLLNLKAIEEGVKPALKVTGVAVALILLVVAAVVLRSVPIPANTGFSRSAAELGSVESIGQMLFSVYLLPFEIASFLLLAGIIGAIVLAKKDRKP